MESKSTPGPWIAAAAPSSIVGWPVVNSEGRSICHLTWYSHTLLPNLTDEQYANFMAEVTANAKLIGAAPDLKDGCNALLGLIQMVCSRDDIPEAIHKALTTNHRVAEAQAAVAKAEA